MKHPITIILAILIGIRSVGLSNSLELYAIDDPTDCTIEVEVPEDFHVCFDEEFNLGGIINGDYEDYEWLENGSSTNHSLDEDVEIDQTTTFTLIAWGSSDENIIVNGDFEDGDSDFTTDYVVGTFSCFGLGNLDCEGTYGIIDDPSTGHANFAACSDVDGGGNMMVINGASSLQEIWCQEVCVEAGANYLFSAWATSVNPASPAQLQFSIDGNLIGSLFSLTSNLCDWEEFEAEWESDASTTVEICVTNQNTAASGNDFALDNIGFYQVCEDNASFTVTHSEFEVDLLGIELLNCIITETEGHLIIDPPGIYEIALSFEETIIETLSTDEYIFTLDTPGEYQFEVIDEWGCTLIYEFEVESEYNFPEVELTSSNDLNCEQLTALLSADSDLRGTYFEWFNSQNELLGEDEELIVSNGGYFYLLATDDDSGCQTLDSIFVGEDFTISEFFILGGDPLTCHNPESMLYISVQSDSVSWSLIGGNNIASHNDTIYVNQPGNYSASIILENGCTAKDTILVEEIDIDFNVSIEYDSLINCRDSFSVVQLNYDSLTYQFDWLSLNNNYSDSSTFVLHSAGTFLYSVTNTEGCVMFDSLVIESDFDILAPELITDSISCSGEQAYISIIDSINEYNVEWIFEDGQIVFSDSAAVNSTGIVQYNMTFVNGCQLSGQKEIFSSENIASLTIEGDTLNCHKETTTLIPLSDQTNLSYLWTFPDGAQTSEDTITVMQNGLYTLQITNEVLCQTEKSFYLEIDTVAPSIEIPQDFTLDCAEESYNSEIIINSEYDQIITNSNWLASGNLNFTIFDSGLYEFEVFGKNGCSTFGSFEVSVDTIPPILNIPSSFLLNCYNPVDSFFVESDSEDSFSWTFNNTEYQTDTIIISESGSYTYEIIGPNSCETTGEIMALSSFDIPEYDLHADTIDCNQLSSRVSISGDDASWDQIEIFHDNMLVSQSEQYVSDEAGVINVIVTSTNGCSNESSINIPIDTTTLEFSLETDPLNCINTQTQIRIVENLVYTSSQVYNSAGLLKGDIEVNISEPDEYTVLIQNTNGCISEENIPVTQNIDPPVITSLISEDIICSESLELMNLEVLDVSQLASISVDQNELDLNNLPISISGAGNHYIELISNNGCTADTLLTIAPLEEIDAYIFPELKLLEGEEHELQIDVNKTLDEIASISWMPTNGLTCYDCLDAEFIGSDDQIYTIKLIDKNGCEDEIELRIIIEKNIKFYVPNVIDLSDSQNNAFTIFSKGNDIENINTLSIYDRWGNLMYINSDLQPNNPEEGWNGTYHDKYVEQGVFVFVAELLLRNGEVKIVSGDVTVLR